LRRKLAECEKAVKRIKFEEALATPVRGSQLARQLPASVAVCIEHPCPSPA
jgi:hypothetical protein